MGLFDRFTKSFGDTVSEAIRSIDAMNLGVRRLDAKVDGKLVTLTGEAPSREVSARVMELFNGMVKTGNTLNTIRVVAPEAPAASPATEPAVAPAAGPRVYEVRPGDTLGGISKQFYGKANLYMKIFEANRDQLDNPDLIKVGQKLRIPE
jgi:LysM repeat protein